MLFYTCKNQYWTWGRNIAWNNVFCIITQYLPWCRGIVNIIQHSPDPLLCCLYYVFLSILDSLIDDYYSSFTNTLNSVAPIWQKPKPNITSCLAANHCYRKLTQPGRCMVMTLYWYCKWVLNTALRSHYFSIANELCLSSQDFFIPCLYCPKLPPLFPCYFQLTTLYHTSLSKQKTLDECLTLHSQIYKLTNIGAIFTSCPPFTMGRKPL